MEVLYHCIRVNFIVSQWFNLFGCLAGCFEMSFRLRNFPLSLFMRCSYTHNGMSAVDQNPCSDFRSKPSVVHWSRTTNLRRGSTAIAALCKLNL